MKTKPTMRIGLLIRRMLGLSIEENCRSKYWDYFMGIKKGKIDTDEAKLKHYFSKLKKK
jgi:hypothetical protein